MQRARKESVSDRVMADIDDADINQFFGEDRHNPPARCWIENVQRVVHNNPERLLYNNAGKSQALFLILVQPTVPSLDRVEERLEMFQSDISKSFIDRANLKDIGRVRISHRGTQGAGWNVGTPRHEHDGLTSRVRNPATSPWPKSADRAKQQGFFSATLCDDEDAFARVQAGARLAQRDTACRAGNPEVIDVDRRILCLIEADATRGAANPIHGQDRFS